MTPGDALVGLVVAAVLALAARSVWRARRSGGCPSCPSGCERCGKAARHEP